MDIFPEHLWIFLVLQIKIKNIEKKFKFILEKNIFDFCMCYFIKLCRMSDEFTQKL